MIAEYNVKLFVREGEMEKIENYEKAVADKTQTWDCHHRLELTLEGEFAHTRKDLKRMEMYYNRPYFELIFLTRAEHCGLHGKTNKGRTKSEEHRKKISETKKGKKLREETRKKMSEARKGKKRPPLSKEHREKISKASSRPHSDFGKKYFTHFGYSRAGNIKQYYRELQWYYRNHKCSWE